MSYQTSPAAMETISKNTIFTNVGLTPEGDVWWEGMTKEVPKGVIDWTGKPWDGKSSVAHPNGRYTAPASQCPVMDPEWENPNGVPICAIVFGGKRFSAYPLVTEAFTWEHGVFMGSLVAADWVHDTK
jgi:phosphoenolpyruvate carboxykinase (GTP)